MEGKLSTRDQGLERNCRLLVCDTTGNVGQFSSPEEEWVLSPIQCLNRAVDLKPELIVVRIGRIALREREALTELSAALKRNSHTRKCPILVLLHSKHRRLIEDLNGVAVDFVKYIAEITLDSNTIRQIVEALRPDDRLQRHLAVLCPFLHDRVIDSQHELTVCGAYLDRMALGGRRLHEICETRDHLACEYYLNPRSRS